ncbi:MAG: hypothetical protein WC744_02355 [Patescibacteria group bacterium]|jgi:hypothetical protein
MEFLQITEVALLGIWSIAAFSPLFVPKMQFDIANRMNELRISQNTRKKMKSDGFSDKNKDREITRNIRILNWTRLAFLHTAIYNAGHKNYRVQS